jgi:hypothetical protein
MTLPSRSVHQHVEQRFTHGDVLTERRRRRFLGACRRCDGEQHRESDGPCRANAWGPLGRQRRPSTRSGGACAASFSRCGAARKSVCRAGQALRLLVEAASAGGVAQACEGAKARAGRCRESLELGDDRRQGRGYRRSGRVPREKGGKPVPMIIARSRSPSRDDGLRRGSARPLLSIGSTMRSTRAPREASGRGGASRRAGRRSPGPAAVRRRFS